MRKTITGFTIVELLIVIVVIAILAAISVVAYTGIQDRANDSRRLSDLASIKKAIKLYASDNGRYPEEGPGGAGTGANGKVGEGSGLDAMLSPYMASVPHDPSGPGDANFYYYYDGYHDCNGKYVALLFAHALKQPKDDGGICPTGSEGGSMDSDAYHIILGSAN